MVLAVRNFGHFWGRELVDWGRHRVSGQILSYRLVYRQPIVVDFREQIGIYVLFSAIREVIYIGQTGAGDRRLFLRLRDHTTNNLRDRQTNFSWFGLRDVNSSNLQLSEQQRPDSRYRGVNSDALDGIESILLRLFEARLNKQGPRWGDNTKEYYQYVKSEWEDTEPVMDAATANLSKMLDRIEKKVNSLKSN